MSLEILLIIAFGGALLTYIAGKIYYKSRNFLVVAISLALVVFVACLYGKLEEKTFYFGFFDLGLVLRLNILSWLFAITIVVVGALSIIFSLSYIEGREKTDFYFFEMALVNAAMLGIVLAGDLLSFYIFWEIMSWSAFLLISYNKGPALAAGMKYIIMSIIGSVCFLVGMLSLYVSFDTLDISQIASTITSASSGYILFILTVFGVTFGIKNAILPFHTWLPDAHSEAPAPFSAVLSGILIKMGTYGFILILYVMIGLKLFLSLGYGWFSLRHILCALGAITILIPSFIAVLQNDAKKLLAWSTVGQAGYIILAIAFGTNIALVAGIFHFFNHALFKALLFFAMGAVEYRTKTRDLNSLGGLIRKMPVVFVCVLVGICGLIGVPLTNGFVSKWLIYKTLILEGSPLLAFFALMGTWGAVLYCYKLIHNVFLGQLPEKYKDVQKSPLSMRLPMIVLSFVIILFGTLPGIPLKVIDAIGTSFGFEPLNVTLWGITSETGTLNTINIFSAVLIAAALVWLVFRSTAKSVEVAQEDSYAAGAHTPIDKYHYTVEFYNPLHRMISPFLRDIIDEFYYWIVSCVQRFADSIRRIYSGDVGYYVMYIILFLAFLIFVQLNWKPW
jgi:formate hydrogenlyase subunit 3/multisubunit Na+/H+ antiporter MnhD subunit